MTAQTQAQPKPTANVDHAAIASPAPVPAVPQKHAPAASGTIDVFASLDNFYAAQRIAKALSMSTMVPKDYQGERGMANCLVALEFAARSGSSPLMVMQNLYNIQGKPSLAAPFVVASINKSGRFTPLDYEFETDANGHAVSCRAVATEIATGKIRIGTKITWKMVNDEGWNKKSGSKWLTMPEQMFRYRAATFWARAYCPEIMMGMQTSDERSEITVEEYEVVEPGEREVKTASAPSGPIVEADMYGDEDDAGDDGTDPDADWSGGAKGE